MATRLDTVPDIADVTTDMVDTWAIDFSNALQAGETISSASAALFLVTVGSNGTAVAGFVTSAVVSGDAVNVAWTGSVLTKFATYRLETKATLSSGAKIELLTTVRCVA